MSTRSRRHAAVPLCGALLLGAVAPLAACSGASAPVVAGAQASSTVISPSSGSPSVPGATAASTGSATGSPVPAAGAGATSPASATAAPTSPHPAATTTSRPATAGAGNGRVVPSCHPDGFAQRAGVARGAVQAYLLAPYAAGAMRGTGTAAALALLHAGQAVRFGTQQLVAARALLATCPRPVAEVVRAVDDQVAALRDLGPAFAANRLPAADGVARVRSAQATTVAAATSAHMPLAALVPTAVQIQTG